MSEARAAILGRLRAVGEPSPLPSLDTAVMERRHWPPAERMARLRQGMEAVRAEFIEARPDMNEGGPRGRFASSASPLVLPHVVSGPSPDTTSDTWPAAVRAFCEREGLKNLLYGPASEAGASLSAAWAQDGTQLMPYDRPVETFKRELFTGVDAGFTDTVGGVAETGGLLLLPSPAEPRLLSLVPPIHIALLRASTIHDTFWSALKALDWGRSLPPNALLISGPSKTADIEQTLAYGVHGPKRLVVVLVDDLN